MRNLLFVIILLCSSSAYKSFGAINGRFVDEVGKPVQGIATILLDSSAQVLIKSAISNDEGVFSIDIHQAGDYQLSIISDDYILASPQKIEYLFNDIQLPDIVLIKKTTELKGVSISHQKPLIEVKSDKIVVNVENSITSAAASVFDMIQRAPGVTIDYNDNIALKGRQGVQIMLDNKIMIVQGSQLINMLKSMPAASIEKIELMSNPGAQYDAAGTGGIINLKTKKDKRKGYNGSAQLGLGQGVYTKSNAGFNFNYRTNKINVFFNSSASLRKGFNKLDLDRIFIKEQQYNGSYKQDNYAIIRLQNYSFNTGIDYNVTNKTTLGMTVSAARTSYTFDGANNGKLFDSTLQYLSYFLSNNHQKNSANNIASNVNLRHSFDSAGHTFSIDADYARLDNDNYQRQNTSYYLPNGVEQKPKYIMEGSMLGYTQIWAIKSDYVRPFSASTKLEAGFKMSAVISDNQPDFYDASSGTKIFDSSKSNHFIYHENISAAYINFNKDWKKWSIQSGLRYEHTKVKGEQLSDGQNFDRNYGQLFPNLSASYSLSPIHQFSLSLSRRIDRPNYEQLNPFKNYIDPTSIHQGNPYLNPSFSYTAELAHIFKGRFITSLGVSHTDNVITQVIILDENKITLVTDKNLANNITYSLNGNYTFKMTSWWNSIESFSFYYSIYEGNLSNTPLKTGLPTAYLSTNNSFVLPKKWSAELNAWFSSDQRYGYIYLRPMYAINIGVQKQFWKNNATVKITASDIFRSQNPIGITQFSNYTETFVVTRDTRTINLSFTYRFGNSKWQRQQREGGAAEERKRAGTGTSQAS